MKKYFKKISALLMAAIMVLSMCTSVFAATKTTATISVANADNAKLTYAQVIVADQTTRTGWNFVNDDVAQAYIDAFKATDAQDAIDKVIANNDASALGLAQATAAGKVTFGAMSNPQTVEKAGVYLVKATEEGYTYNIMGAYIGFGTVTIEGKTYDYPSLTDASIEAKKAPIQVTKTVEDENKDNVTKTGDILEYTVKTNVPYIAPTDTDRTFEIRDELTGAEYTDEAMTITLAGNPITNTIEVAQNKMSFKVNLDNLITNDNANAGKEIVITYKVKVTAANDTITNKATAGHKDRSDYGSKTTTTYEGSIELTKTDAETGVKLAGAGFEVRKGSKDSQPLNFVKIKDGAYKYDPNGTITEVVTGEDGKVTVKGLDVGTYYFKEITAPKGYSVNTTQAEATLEIKEKDENGKATAALTAETSMTDTKLSALPSTGGMGTYLFTIVGVVLMACAAGAFFISRKKSSEE